MKMYIVIFCFLLSGTLNAREVKYKLYLKDNCKSTIEQVMYYVLKIGDEVYYPNEASGILELPDTGRYELYIVERLEPIEIIIDDYKLKIDTISTPTINFKIETTSQPKLSGFYCCDTLCNGDYIDYYLNGNIRIEGKFKQGRAIGVVKYYNRKGGLIEGKVYNRHGKVKKTIKYN